MRTSSRSLGEFAAIAAVAVMIALVGGCVRKGTANTLVGAVCTTKRDCDSACWEGFCTIACQSADECPEKMTCISDGVCAFTCIGDRTCGGWQCIDKRRFRESERVMVCIPNFGGGDPNDFEEDPADDQQQP